MPLKINRKVLEREISIQRKKLDALFSTPLFLDDTDDRRQDAEMTADLIKKLEEIGAEVE